MKVVTSVTAWNDSVGKRVSITYSEVDETGKITSDNGRIDKVVVDKDAKTTIDSLLEYAQELIDAE